MPVSGGVYDLLDTKKDELTHQLMQDVSEIFTTMVGLEHLLLFPAPTEPVTRFKDCVSSLVGIAGTYNGMVSLHMPSNVAMGAASGMMGMEVSELNDDLIDAMGEIASMIAGAFKMQLSKGGLDIQLSIPSVIHGKEYVISLGNTTDHIAVRFANDDDWFLVSVAFERA